MSENSAIAWCDYTFNPWLGCSKVSAGCAHGTRAKTAAKDWNEPLKWDRAAKASGVRARVFCASMGDVFEEWDGPILDSRGRVLWRCECGDSTVEELDDCPRCGDGCAGLTLDDLRRDLFRLIDATPHLDWLVLTKRPENLASKWPRICFPDAGDVGALGFYMRFDNVWLGTSIEDVNQVSRWEMLRAFRGVCRHLWWSVEPMLGPMLLIDGMEDVPDWIVFGGESNQGCPARPCDPKWIRLGVAQCVRRGIAPYVKQLGSNVVGSEHSMRIMLRDKAGADPAEWPDDLRVREFPEVKVK